jgi:hypothetical protein
MENLEIILKVFVFDFLRIICLSRSQIFREEGFGDVMERFCHAFWRGGALPHFDVLFDLVDWRFGVGDNASMSNVKTA